MARLPDLVRFCKKHGLLLISIAELVHYRMQSEPASPIATLHLECPA
jgi:3,4-dihydroxy 2-butanone 4-phosphate synthase/GTP cyclohydrolase II